MTILSIVLFWCSKRLLLQISSWNIHIKIKKIREGSHPRLLCTVAPKQQWLRYWKLKGLVCHTMNYIYPLSSPLSLKIYKPTKLLLSSFFISLRRHTTQKEIWKHENTMKRKLTLCELGESVKNDHPSTDFDPTFLLRNPFLL